MDDFPWVIDKVDYVHVGNGRAVLKFYVTFMVCKTAFL